MGVSLIHDEAPASLPRLPARGQYTESARLERLEFVRRFTGAPLAEIQETSLDPAALTGNIENLIGSVELPVGVAGPLLFRGERATGLVLLPLATSEGALVASVSRGATALSRSGGVTTRVLQQRMIRVPSFEFEGVEQSLQFTRWMEEHLPQLREQIAQVSNHARLIAVEPIILGRVVHLRFVYETGDAAGQNMTTSCTWHACRWALERIPFAPLHFYVEANASGDKKLSYLSFLTGRGTRVIAECLLTREAMLETLKVTPEAAFEGYQISVGAAIQSGMVGHNINLANVVAGTFIATGQDVACVHESSVGHLTLQLVDGGLYASMVLPNLVVGTVGGGTHLPHQRAMLEMLGCVGAGKAGRLAEIIAGYALALDLSTMTAIATGQFAAAHERLGRNRPVRFFTARDLTPELFRETVLRATGDPDAEPRTVAPRTDLRLGPSIITEVTARKANRQKQVGLFPLRIGFARGDHAGLEQLDVMVKVKPLDEEVHLVAGTLASLGGEALGQAYAKFKHQTGFTGTHHRELAVHAQQDPRFVRHVPALYQAFRDDAREAYVLVTELLQGLVLMDSADDAGAWGTEHVAAAVRGIAEIHAVHYGKEEALRAQPWLEHPWSAAGMVEAAPLWDALLDNARSEFPELFPAEEEALHRGLIETLPRWAARLEALPKTLIHNDFNPRNLALRDTGEGLRLCAYDWELATIHLPQHDLAELLAFVLTPEATRAQVDPFVELHRRSLERATGAAIDPEAWREGYGLCLKDLLVNRMALYLMNHTHRQFAFVERALATLRRLLAIERAREAGEGR